MTATEVQLCTRGDCVADRQQIRQILRILGPSMTPGASPVEALEELLRTSQRVLRQRNAYKAALHRVHGLGASTLTLGHAQVPIGALASAMYVREQDLN